MEEKPERLVLTPRLILKVFGVSLLLFLVNVVLNVTGLAYTDLSMSLVSTFCIYFSAFSFAFGVLIAAIYYFTK